MKDAIRPIEPLLENLKRRDPTIGLITAKKFAKALGVDYRKFV